MTSVLFILALLGFYFLYTSVLGKKACFFPLMLISSSVLTLYIFDIVGLLSIGYWIFLIAGCVMLPVSLYLTRKDPLKDKLISLVDPTIIFMILGVIWIRFITRDRGLSNPDDFSHWFRMCKVMFYDNSYPVTPEIGFSTYPPGTATWIYIVTKSFGFSIANCFTAQAAVNMASVSVLFGVLQECKDTLKKVLLSVCVVVSFLLLTSVTVSTLSLAVDGTLGMVAFAVLVFIAETKFDEKKDVVSLILILTFLVMVKFSGLFFAVAAIALFIAMKKGKALRTVLVIAVPVVLSLLYRVRNSFIYTDINQSRQASSVERFLDLLHDKSPELIWSVIKGVIVQSVSFMNGYAQIMLVWGVFFGFVLLIIFEKKKETKFWFKFVLIVYWVYVFFMILMYIFSMSTEEAAELGSFYRYMGTIAILVAGIFCYYMLKKLASESMKNFYLAVVLYIVLAVLGGHVLFNYDYLVGGDSYIPGDYWYDDAWNALAASAEENTEYTEDSYLVIWNQDIWDGYFFPDFCKVDMMETFFRSKNIEFVIAEDPSSVEVPDGEYDHITVVM